MIQDIAGVAVITKRRASRGSETVRNGKVQFLSVVWRGMTEWQCERALDLSRPTI